jgi:hypothetical protein
MGDVPVLGCQIFWTNQRSTLKSETQTLVQQYPDADAQLRELLKLLGDIEDVAGHTPASVGEVRIGLRRKTERAVGKLSVENHFLVPRTASICNFRRVKGPAQG